MGKSSLIKKGRICDLPSCGKSRPADQLSRQSRGSATMPGLWRDSMSTIFGP
jgi:hypothetical protein